MVLEKGKKRIELDPIEQEIIDDKKARDPRVARALKGKKLHEWYLKLVDKTIKSGEVLHKDVFGGFGKGKSMIALTDAYLVYMRYKLRYKWKEDFNVNERIAQSTEDMTTLINNLKKKSLARHSKDHNIGHAIGPVIRDEVTTEHGEGTRIRYDRLKNLIRIHRLDGLWVTMVEQKPTCMGYVNEITMAFEIIGNSWSQKYESKGNVRNFHPLAKQIANSNEGTLCFIHINYGQGWQILDKGHIVFRSIEDTDVIEKYLILKQKFNEEYGIKHDEKIGKFVNRLLEIKKLEKLYPVHFDAYGEGKITRAKIERHIERLAKQEKIILEGPDIKDIALDYEAERVERALKEREEL